MNKFISPISVLFFISLSSFIMRYAILNSQALPPSNDVAGDLYLAHVWTGNSIPQLRGVIVQPPLYFFIIVIPFTTFFSVLRGMIIYMSFVPAILTIPTYLLSRNIGLNRLSGYLASFLVGISAIFGNMMTWNAGYNLFGMFFLILAANFLINFLRKPSKINAFYVSLLFALTVGTHPLSALVLTLTIVISLPLFLISKLDKMEEFFTPGTFKLVLLLFLLCALFSLPFIPLYLNIYGITAITGTGYYSSNYMWLVENVISYPWGFQGFEITALVILDVIISIVSIVFIIKMRSEAGSILAGLIISSVLVSIIDPANISRGLYFLVIPLMILVSSFIWKVYVTCCFQLIGRMTKHVFTKRLIVKVLASILVFLLVLLNLSYSVSSTQASDRFYQELTPSNLKALNWIKNNTSKNAIIYDATGMQTWIWGYSSRMAYSPSPLSGEVTSYSIQVAKAADYIFMGNYILGNNNAGIGFNLPAQVGTPEIYLPPIQGYWTEFMITQANNVLINVTDKAGFEQSLNLAYSRLVNVSMSSFGGEEFGNFTLFWNNCGGIYLTLGITLNQDKLSVGWTSNVSSIDSVLTNYRLLPSGSNFVYNSVSDISGNKHLEDTFSYYNKPLNLIIRSREVSQEVTGSGWTDVNITSSDNYTIYITSNFGDSVFGNFSLDTFSLVRDLSINYILVNEYSQYPFFDRMLYDLTIGVTPVKPVQLFSSGGVYIFGLYEKTT